MSKLFRKASALLFTAAVSALANPFAHAIPLMRHPADGTLTAGDSLRILQMLQILLMSERMRGYLDLLCVSGNARIEDYATVTGSASVSGNAFVQGHAVVAEKAKVMDYAIIADYAGVMGDSDFFDNARVIESGLVFNTYSVSGNAAVKGVAYGLAGGAAIGAPAWNERKTGGNGVLTFDGSNYLIGDCSYAALHDADYQTAILLCDNDKNTIFRFGNDDKYMLLTAENGSFTFELNDGNGTQTVSAENAYQIGHGATVSVILTNDTAKLVVNDGSDAIKPAGELITTNCIIAQK